MAQIEKIMSIYYGSNKLPYKDEDRQTHYPIVGGDLFIGENNTTKVRFYVDRIGGAQFAWLATVKKPDGSLCYELLDSETLADGYVDLDLASMYLDQQGAVFIGLTGFTANDVNIIENDGVYVVNGNPQRLVTGTIKIMVNYAPQILNIGTDISYSQYQQILAQLSKKLGLNQAVIFYGNIADIQSTEIQTSDLSNGQLCYDETTKWFYTWNTTNEEFNRIDLKSNHNLFGSIPIADYGYNTTLATLFSNGYRNKHFILNVDEPFIYYLTDSYITRFNIISMYYQVVSASDTSKTISQAFTGATYHNAEQTSNKESSTIDTTSTTKYPSSKATADYVKSNAIASYTFDSSTYQIKFYNGNGVQVGNTIDLPVESVVVSGTYDSTNKQIILTLVNGNTITISVSDLVSGLVSTSDIVDNLNSTDSTKVLSAKQGKELNDTKLNKSNSTNVVYATDSNGAQTTIEHSTSVRTDVPTVPVRVSGTGAVRVGTPQGDFDAVNKKYFDDYGEKLANKTTSLSSSSTDTQYPSAKCVFDIVKKIEDKANGCTTSYLTSVDLTEQDIVDGLGDGVVYRYVGGEWTLITTEGEFNLWKSINQVSLNQDFFASTNEQLVLSNELAYHYAIIVKDSKFYLITASDYDKLFVDGDNLFIIGEYLDRFYFSNVLEINNGGSPIINESTITSTTPSQNLNSLITYKCTNALTSLSITGLSVGTNDNNPTWKISFIAGNGFTITLASGITWKYGTPNFDVGSEYTIYIEKRVDTGYYAFLI